MTYEVRIISQIDGGVLAVHEFETLAETTDFMENAMAGDEYALCDIETIFR